MHSTPSIFGERTLDQMSLSFYLYDIVQPQFLAPCAAPVTNVFLQTLQHGRDSQLVTSLELKSNTQKSRIAELEGTMEMSRENMNNIRKQSLTLQEKISRYA